MNKKELINIASQLLGITKDDAEKFIITPAGFRILKKNRK
jgi:hypothetical protein